MPTEANPMIQSEYKIYESPTWPMCSSSYPASRILNKKYPNPMNFDGVVISGPMTFIEVERYMSDETSKLLAMIKLAQQCETPGVQGVCSSVFKKPNKIDEAETNPFKGFSYTDEYINSKLTLNDKKPLCQRYADILQMLEGFLTIIKELNNTDITRKYLDHYYKIMSVFEKNNALRKGLEAKLNNLYGEDTYYDDSKKFLDSTIYISVLWTVLATSTLFFIFKKM